MDWVVLGQLCRASLPPKDISARAKAALGGRGGAMARMSAATSHSCMGRTLWCMPESVLSEGVWLAQGSQCPCMEREMTHSPRCSPCSLQLAWVVHPPRSQTQKECAPAPKLMLSLLQICVTSSEDIPTRGCKNSGWKRAL